KKTGKRITTSFKNTPFTVFNATPTSVTLLPAGKVKRSQPERLKITAAALLDAFGRPLNGGQNFTATFGRSIVTSAQVKDQSRIGTLSVAAVDALLGFR